MNFRNRILVMLLALSTVSFGTIAWSQTPNCVDEAAQSATHFAQNNNNFYHCVSLSAKDEGAKGIVVEMVCSADTGNHSVTVSILFNDPSTCSEPVFTQTSLE